METYIMYKFTCNDENVISTYVGHTKCFKTRKTSHKTRCNNENGKEFHFKLYVEIRANGGWDNWTMTPLEEYKCDNKLQARIREQYWTNDAVSTLNMCKAYKSPQDYLDYNKQMQHKMYYKHIDKIKARREIRFTCECGGKYSGICHKLRHIATNKHQQYILSHSIL